MTDAAADDPRLWRLLADEIGRRIRRRVRVGILHPLRFAGSTPERLLAAPPDLRPADPEIARRFYAGTFPLAGRTYETSASPFMADFGDPLFQAELHGFGWLRHFRAAGTELAAANARTLALDWLRRWSHAIEGAAWRPDIVARRVEAWLSHSSILLQGAELAFYRAFLRSLAAQVRYLDVMVPDMPPGEERLVGRVALAFAALSLPAGPSRLARASRELGREIDHQILADGGHVSRDPSTLLRLLAEFLPLRQTYANQAEPPPASLVAAIDRMFPALRFFLHGDGAIARFNGAGVSDTVLLAAVLRHDEARGAILRATPHSGYQRLACGDVTVICDTGVPPPPRSAGAAHAGTLSFEFSDGGHAVVVNAGGCGSAPRDWRPLARSTAAHSTVTVADQSAARFSLSRRTEDLLGAPLVAGPAHVPVERMDGPEGQSFRASHDGYRRRLGVIHERTLALRTDGGELVGIDRLIADAGTPAQPAALRFHLHPDIAAMHDDKGRLVLVLPDGNRWAFSADGPVATVEETIFFADPSGPRKSLQIVIDIAADDQVAWRFTRATAPPAA